MSVKIRLSRIGKKHVPFHRIIVVDSRKKRDAAYLDNLGTYDAQKSQVVTFNEALYNEWIGKGAQPTDSARKIFKQFKKIGLDPLTQKKKVAKPQVAQKQKATETTEAKAEDVSGEVSTKTEAPAKTDKAEKPVEAAAQEQAPKEEAKAEKAETKKTAESESKE